MVLSSSLKTHGFSKEETWKQKENLRRDLVWMSF